MLGLFVFRISTSLQDVTLAMPMAIRETVRGKREAALRTPLRLSSPVSRFPAWRVRRISVMGVISEAKIQVEPETPARGIRGQLAVALQVVVAGAEVRELRIAAAIRRPPEEVAAAQGELRARHAVHAAHLRQPRSRDPRA